VATAETQSVGVVIQSWVPVALAEELKRHAASERRSVSSVIRIAVEDAVRRDTSREARP
jgi:hypothetical protein